MASKKSSNKKASLTELESRWLNGEWLLGSEPRMPDDTMKSLALMSGMGSSEELFAAHGNPETHFWRLGMGQPITLTELRDHEACWLTPDNDKYGGESFFIWKFYDDDQKQKLWGAHGNKALYKWNADLRRPIPIDADENDATNSFLTIGPFCC